MRSFILATVAIVVPSLNVLLMITELPTLIGTSRISPVMVERINVLLNEALFLVIPSFTISRLSLAVCNSSRACFTFNDGTTIATVANMNDLIFRGNLDETEVGRVHEGMPVKLTIGALQNLSFNAVLEYISPKGVEENGANQFEIKAAIQAPDSVQIRSGYSANAEIVLERALKTLALPESTVEFSGDSTFVYVLTDSVPQQKFKRQQIEVGMSDGIKIAVTLSYRRSSDLRSDQRSCA